MIRFGKISEYKAATGYARVQFEDIGIVSDYLPVVFPSTKTVTAEFPITVGNQVACLMDDQCNAGVILGCVFSDDVEPVAANENKFQVKFDDGLIMVYDKSSKTLNFKISTTELIMTASGWTIKRGSESLKSIISDTLDKIMALTVTTPVGPSGVPINLADFAAIKTRLPNLFEG